MNTEHLTHHILEEIVEWLLAEDIRCLLNDAVNEEPRITVDSKPGLGYLEVIIDDSYIKICPSMCNACVSLANPNYLRAITNLVLKCVVTDCASCKFLVR